MLDDPNVFADVWDRELHGVRAVRVATHAGARDLGWAFPDGSDRDYAELTRAAIEADSGG